MMNLIAQNNMIRGVVLLAIFLIVAVGARLLLAALDQRSMLREQVGRLAGGQLTSAPGPALRVNALESSWAKLTKKIEDAGLNLSDTDQERLSALLRSAGFKSPSAPKLYTLTRLCLIFILPSAYVLLAYAGGEPPSFTKMYLYGAALALLGLLLPRLFVQARADRRKEEIVNGFPDCLDLILVCVESGLGLEAAIDRVGREMVVSHPRVAELLSLTVLQLRAGASREEAFRKLADASAVEDIRSFTTLVIQSDKLGTSIATTLRVYSAEMREKRRMRAEEKAHRLPVLISIPLVACMLPTMIGTLMLPAVIMVAREILPIMAGGR
jgi:tight adherence protein C